MIRRMFAARLLAVAFAFAACAAHAAPTVVAEGTAATKAVIAKPRCMRHTEIGSLRIKKICMPAERWNRLTAEERDAVIRSERGAAILED